MTQIVVNPFVSEAQRRWMYANHPAMAEEWKEHTLTRKLPYLKRSAQNLAYLRKKKRALAKNSRAQPATNAKKPYKSPLKIDPTRTLTLRRAFAARLRRLFHVIKRNIIQGIAVEDWLGLKASSPIFSIQVGNAFCPGAGARDNSCPPANKGAGEAGRVYHHGTSSLEAILKEGVVPGGKVRVWDQEHYQDPARAGSVYLAENQNEAAFYAFHAARKSGGKAYVLKIEVPANVKLELDEHHLTGRRLVGSIPPSWIKGYAEVPDSEDLSKWQGPPIVSFRHPYANPNDPGLVPPFSLDLKFVNNGRILYLPLVVMDTASEIRREVLYRPRRTENVFCPNGPGGGIDPSCSPGQTGSGGGIDPTYSPGAASPSQVEAKFSAAFRADKAEMVEKYIAKHGPANKEWGGAYLVNTDEARELCPEYAKDRESRARYALATLQTSQDIARAVFEEAMTRPVEPGHSRVVVLTAGGPGAGKSTGIRASESTSALLASSHVVFDSTTPKDYALKLALDKGFNVHVVYTYRDPVDAFEHGAIPRAIKTGRPVDYKTAADTWAKARDEFIKTREKYKNDPRVAFTVIDNSRGLGNAAVVSAIPEGAKNHGNLTALKGRLRAITERLYQEGKIPESVYWGTLGLEKPDRPAKEVAGRGAGPRTWGRGRREPEDELRIEDVNLSGGYDRYQDWAVKRRLGVNAFCPGEGPKDNSCPPSNKGQGAGEGGQGREGKAARGLLGQALGAASKVAFKEGLLLVAVDRDDLDAIERLLPVEEARLLERAIEQDQDAWMDFRMEGYDPYLDRVSAIREIGFRARDQVDKLEELVDASDLADDAKDALMESISLVVRMRGNVDARSLSDHLLGAVKDQLPDEQWEIFRDWADAKGEELDQALKMARDQAIEEALSEYDDSEVRETFLHEYYDEVLVASSSELDTWGKNRAGNDLLWFETSSGARYEVKVFPTDLGFETVPQLAFFDDRGSIRVTGAGSAKEVMTKVTGAALAWLRHNDPDLLYFSAEEESRRGLYDKLVRTLAAAAPEYAAIAMEMGKSSRGYMVVKRARKEELLERMAKKRLARPSISSSVEVLVNRWRELAPIALNESYFATCDRDAEGRCLPGEGGGKARDVTVEVDPDDERDLKNEFAMTSDRIADLVGAQDGARLTIKRIGDHVSVEIQHDDYQAIRNIYPEEKRIENKWLKVYEEGQGLGTKILAEQVKAAARQGYAEIVTEAARGRGYNGYYTWARLGYDARLDEVPLLDRGWVIDAKSRFGAETVQDLMKTEEGRDWWEANGETFRGTFSLDQDSISRMVLEAYVKHKRGPVANTLREMGLDSIDHALLDLIWATVAAGLDPRKELLTRRKDLASNTRWKFFPDPEKLKAFQQWIKSQLAQTILNQTEEQLWTAYIEEGFRKGAGRVWDDVNKKKKTLAGTDKAKLDFYQGMREEFLRSSFAAPESIDKVKLMASRTYTDLENVTSAMSTQMTRTLTDGLVQGMHPTEIAKELVKDVAGIGEERALMIARSEMTRAHSEGQLAAMENLGIDEVGVAVEWSTAEDEAVCPLCAALEGVVLKVEEAHGMLPRHPNCRCAWIPAGIGEDDKDQILAKGSITKAILKSQKLAGDAEGEDWGPAKDISKDRPGVYLQAIENKLLTDDPLGRFSDFLLKDRIVGNVYCPTGEGGGIDPSCSPPFTSHNDHHASGEGWKNPPPWRQRSYGAVLFNKHGNQVLLREVANHWDGYHWTFAKGKMDREDENPADTAKREVLEEMGRKIRLLGYVPGAHVVDYGIRFGKWQGQSTTYFFIAESLGQVQDHDEETSRVRWCSYAKAKELLSQSTNDGGRQRDLEVLDLAFAAMQARTEGKNTGGGKR